MPRRNPCRTCSLCCRYYAVPLTGYDIWRIWRSQRLRPEKFVAPLLIDNDSREAFRLGAGGSRYLLILDKTGARRPSSPCIFLVTLPGGHDRCGIYPDRPAACRAYPMIPDPAGIRVSPRALCPADSWTSDDVASQDWRSTVQETELAFDVYAVIVAAWNDRVNRQPGREFAFSDYYDFLFNTYERIAALDAFFSPSQVQAIQASRSLATGGNEATTPFLDYLGQIQQIVSALLAD